MAREFGLMVYWIPMDFHGFPPFLHVFVQFEIFETGEQHEQLPCVVHIPSNFHNFHNFHNLETSPAMEDASQL